MNHPTPRQRTLARCAYSVLDEFSEPDWMAARFIRTWAFHEAGHRWAADWLDDSGPVSVRLSPVLPGYLSVARRPPPAFDLLPNEQLIVAAAGVLADAAFPAADRAAERMQPFDVLDIEDPAIGERLETSAADTCHRSMCQGDRRQYVLAALDDGEFYAEQLTNLLADWASVHRIATHLIADRPTLGEVLRLFPVPEPGDVQTADVGADDF